jgi:hypothetical protein
MGRSTLAIFSFSFAVGVDLVVLFLPQLTGEPRSATATSAILTIQKTLLSSLSDGRTTTLQGDRSRQAEVGVIHPTIRTTSRAAPDNPRNLAERLSFNGPPPKRSERLW